MKDIRIDPVEKEYKPIEKIGKMSAILFWLLICLSLFTLYSKSILSIHYYEITNNFYTALYIILVVLSNILFVLNRFYYLPRAENKRRRELLSNSFNIRLEISKSNLYYNNQLSPSIAKLGLNLFENTLFGKTICLKMAKAERPRIIGYLILWLISVVWRFTDLQLIVIIFQILFSTQILIRYISIEYTRSKLEILFNQLHHIFLDSDKCSRNDTFFNVNILAIFAEYESTKSAALFKQSTNVFKEINPTVSEEWENIKKELELVPKKAEDTRHEE